MTATPNLASQAEEFFFSTWEVICRVLPVGDAEPTVVINEDADHMVAEFQIPLAFSGSALAQDENPESFSDMFWAAIRYDMCPDRTGRELAVRSSKFELRVHTAPGIRFEYERDNTTAPRSHVHYSGMGGLLSTAIMRNFSGSRNRKRKGDVQDVHVPTGGARFRPSLEDFLYFVIAECGFRAREGWSGYLLERREAWFDRQLGAAVRDHPRVARAALEKLGYRVLPPTVGDTPPGRYRGW